MSSEITSGVSDEAVDIPSCALDKAGLADQRGRYARLAPSVTRLVRTPEVLVTEFAPGFDRGTLEEALAVERACCPFFEFDLDESERRLRTTVREPDHLPALDALAHALGGADRVVTSREG